MPTLNWIGKDAVVRHHKDVPYRLLEPVPELSCLTTAHPLPPGEGRGEGAQLPTGSENLIVQGDNLHALKALLPRYAGQVKCIYIDPPYNTGNEGWAYNDNVNSAEIRKWLGEVVGKEGETLDRHDRWLCMMYPRLVLLKQFLRDDGAIFVSIDDNEVAALRLLMDEVFGGRNFVATVAWHKRVTPANDAKYLSSDLDFILIYARSFDCWRPNRLAMNSEQLGNYRNPDDDRRGAWNSAAYTCAKTADERPNLYYSIKQPNTGEEIWPSRTRVWAYDRQTHLKHVADDLIYWGLDRTSSKPRIKKFLTEAKQVVPRTFWLPDDTGHNQEARLELDLLGFAGRFSTPKPTRLIQRILQIATDKDSLVLDSFAGSGTTGHAVLKANADDGGNRRFILVEMDPGIAENVTTERVRRVAQGYRKGRTATMSPPSPPTPLSQAGEGSDDWVPGLGGGFQFCRLSADPLFTADGAVRPDVGFAQLAEFVWFSETGTGLGAISTHMSGAARTPLLGVHEGRAIYLLYNGILKDRSPVGGNVLTAAVLELLPPHAEGPRVIYAAACRLGVPRLQREGIVFKQTPYALAVSA